MDEGVKRNAVQTEEEKGSAKSVTAKERAAKKRRFRAAALKKRDSLTPEQRKCYSDRIIKNLINLSCYQNADALLTYISFRSEVDTFPLLERALADGKTVFAPKVNGKEMDFYRIFSADDLTMGYQGILEPVGGQLFEKWIDDQTSQYQNHRKEKLLTTKEVEACPNAISSVLICLPGAAFDRACHRIGYGGGFYDRYLSSLWAGGENGGGETDRQTERKTAQFATAALAYNCQVFEEIPWEQHDIRPQQIITETGTIN